MSFGLADLPSDLFLNLQQRLNRFVTRKQRFEDFIFRNHPGAAFDHNNGVPASGEKNIRITVSELALCRINNPLPVDSTDPHAS